MLIRGGLLRTYALLLINRSLTNDYVGLALIPFSVMVLSLLCTRRLAVASLLVVGATGCGKDAEPTPPAKVTMGIFTDNTEYLGAQAQLTLLKASHQVVQSGWYSVPNNAMLRRPYPDDSLLARPGDSVRLVLQFKNVTKTNFMQPGPSSKFTGEILVNGQVQGQVILDATTPYTTAQATKALTIKIK